MWVSGRAARAVGLALAIFLGVVGVAVAARAGGYSGGTSQGQKVSLRISGGAVQGFTITMHDTCPDGHILIVPEMYPRMPIVRGRFGGRFTPQGQPAGTNATLSGKVGRREVTGTLKDTNFSNREHALCHGSATFTAHHN